MVVYLFMDDAISGVGSSSVSMKGMIMVPVDVFSSFQALVYASSDSLALHV